MSKIHNMKLKPTPFEEIKKGTKTIELRLYDEKRKQIKAGDTIVFVNTDCSDSILYARVKQLHLFKSFEELYKCLPPEKFGYAPNEIADASYTDMEEYYSKEEQALYGVVGIEIELLPKC